MAVTVEVCVEGVRSAVAAEQGGADRVELCASMAVEGLTPDPAAVAETCRLLRIPVHILIRPRAGDSVYRDDEFGEILRCVRRAGDLGAAGVVVGVNRTGGTIDRERLSAIVERARPLSVTYHKAFDVLRDLSEGLDVLAGLGVDRVLTSGGAATAREGAACLGDLMRRGAGRVAIMAGGRVRAEDIMPLAAAGLTELHVGSAVMAGGRTDAAKVWRFVEAVRRAGV